MHRKIERFYLDDVGDWVAELSCGHPQHVRHKPPWEQRPWVLTDAGRAARVGSELDCLFCNMPALPPDASVYKSTSVFDETTVPRALTKSHRTKQGTWGRIVVSEGTLRYQVDEPEVQSWVLRPGIPGIIAPGAEHHVATVGAVRFRIEFLRAESDPTGRT